MATNITDHELNLILTTRYLLLTGIIILLHDHITSFRQERRLVWRGPRSFTNCAFLLNRYLVPVLLVLVFVCISGFAGFTLSDQACWGADIAVGLCTIISLAFGNSIVTGHVVKLWEDQKSVKRVIWGGYAITYLASALALVFALRDVGGRESITWIDQVHSCVVIKTSRLFIPAWAIGLAYECFLLGVRIWNSIDRPRQSDVSLPRALRNDGILHLLVRVILRGIQTAMVSTLDSRYFLLLHFFLWAVVTTTLSRAFFSMRQEEALQSARIHSQRIESSAVDTSSVYIGHWKETHRDDEEESSSAH